MPILVGLILFKPQLVSADDELVDLIKSVKPSIVAIGSYFVKDTPKGRFFGTGFAIGQGRHVVTNEHVLASIEKEKRISHLRIFHPKFTSSGIKAKKVAQDSDHDLALLRLHKAKLPPLPL